MVILHLFIDYHYKSIVSTITERHVLTLHLSTANWRKLTGSCCKNTPTHMLCNFYQIESYHSSSSCGPLSMQINGTLILLYFIEMLPHTVSNSTIEVNYTHLLASPQTLMLTLTVNGPLRPIQRHKCFGLVTSVQLAVELISTTVDLF